MTIKKKIALLRKMRDFYKQSAESFGRVASSDDLTKKYENKAAELEEVIILLEDDDLAEAYYKNCNR